MIQNHPCRYLLKKNENVSKKKKKKDMAGIFTEVLLIMAKINKTEQSNPNNYQQ